MARVQVITSDREKAEMLRQELTESGHAVAAGRLQESLRNRLLKIPPDVIVIDLERVPASGRDLGIFLRVRKATRHCQLVFIDGKPDSMRAIQQILPDAIYARANDLLEPMTRGLANLLEDPIVPESVFAGYSGRSVADKLGIKADMQVTLINAPDYIPDAIDPLPKNVDLGHDLERTPDLVLWFTRKVDDLRRGLPSLQEKIPEGKLWILWPKKTAGLDSDLTQQVVRQHGLDSGWVDFKICSFDDTWSGLCFTARK